MQPKSNNPISIDDLLAEAGWLRALAARLARDTQTADDLTQGVLAEAVARPPASGRPLRPWLASVLRNLALNARRRDGRREQRERVVARTDHAPAADAVLEQFEEQQKLARLVAELPPTYRAVLLRRYWRGESAAQIARATDTSDVTVRSRLARGLAKLRERYERLHDDDRDRSLAALAIAEGEAPTLGWLATTASSLLLMNTSLKITAAAATALALYVGITQLGSGNPVPLTERPLEHESPVVLADDDTADEKTPAASEDESARTALSNDLSVTEESTEAVEVREDAILSLRAIDAYERPIEGARISFTKRDGAPIDLPASTPSGADGRVSIDVPRAATFRYMGSDERITTLKLSAPGYATTYFVEGVTPGSEEELGDRVLEVGTSISGRVLDPLGAPLAGAEVVALVASEQGKRRVASFGGPAFGPMGPPPGELLPRTRSDANGLFRLDGVAQRDTFFWFRIEGYPWQKSETFELLVGKELLVELELDAIAEENLVVGRVLRPDGTPAVGARVRTKAFRFFSEDTIPVGVNGELTLAVSAENETLLVAYDPSNEFGESEIVQVTGSATVELRLSEAHWLDVRVQTTDGEPIERAWMIPLVGGTGTGRDFEHTDADGRFRTLVPATIFQQRVGAFGYLTQDLGPFEPHALPEELVVTLEREPELRGIVRANGKPVADATVELVHSPWGAERNLYKGFPSRYDNMPVSRTTTDEDGTFGTTLDEPSDRVWAILVQKEGFGQAEFVVGPISNVDDVERIEIELTPGGTLEGEVLVGSTRSREGIVVGCSRGDGRPHFTRTDANGRYRFENLGPGPWMVEDRATEPEGRSSSAVSEEDYPFLPQVTIAEGETSYFDIDLRWQDGLTVTGHVTIDGKTPRGFTAQLQTMGDDGYSSIPVEVQDDGSFEIPARAGEMRVMITGEIDGVRWSIDRRVNVGPNPKPLEVALETALVNVWGRKPRQSLRAQKIHPGSEDATWVDFEVDDEGRAALRVPSGSVRLTQLIEHPQYGNLYEMIERFDVETGATRRVPQE